MFSFISRLFIYYYCHDADDAAITPFVGSRVMYGAAALLMMPPLFILRYADDADYYLLRHIFFFRDVYA